MLAVTVWKYTLWVAALQFVLSGAACADPVIDQARDLLTRQQAPAAYALLAPLADERAGDPDFDFLLGLAALDAGHPGEAVFALERVLSVQPDHALARAEIARAYYALSEYETARLEFENVKAGGNVPTEAQETMDRYLALIERAQSGGGPRISGFVTAGAGYDTNVNSGTDESRVAIPILGNVPFQLVDEAVENEHAYTLIAGGVNVNHPLSKELSVVGGARGYYRNTESPFSTRDAYLYGGLQGERGKHQVTVAAQGEHFEVDADTLRYVYGGFGQWTYAVDNRSRFNLSVQATQLDYPDLGNRDAMRYVGAAGYLLAIGGKREPVVFAGAYGGTEDEDDGDFPQFGHDLYGARIGGSLELFTRTRGYASVSFEQRDYHGDDPIFLRTRDDTQFIVSTGVEFAASETWFVRPNVSYTNNDSNLPINDYDRIVAGVDVTMRF